MKRIIIACALALCGATQAAEVARAMHPVADLALFDSQGGCADGQREATIFYADASAPPIHGCYFEAHGYVWVIWSDGDLLGYRKSLFGAMGS